MEKLTSAGDILYWGDNFVDLPVSEVLHALADACGADLYALGYLHLVCDSEHLKIQEREDTVRITSTAAFVERFRCKLAISVSREAFEQFSTFPAS